ncbi:hypothetical protein [Sulfitobacter sp. JB4-11]|uniref:hypothetical protein n=1 Tax=Sulfitobacter rhodophyticola TaxID=3238304 RepID=UPI00351685D0
MTRIWMGLALGCGLAACGGTPPFGGDATDPDPEPGADTSAGSIFIDDEDAFLRLNNIEYDSATDTLRLNNLPFDDDNNVYARIPGSALAGGFGAYESLQDGPGEVEYFAVFRRSDSGLTQVASANTTQYSDFGYGGAGAQRIAGGVPVLPNDGAIYVFTGNYAAVRTTTNTAGRDTPNFVTGTAQVTADFGDFDVTGAINGRISNRILYDENGVSLGALDTVIVLEDTTIDRATGIIDEAEAFEIENATGDEARRGDWSGVVAGPGGTEVSGYIIVQDGSGTSDGEVREVGGFITDR